MSSKKKGTIAEAKIKADLLLKGYNIAVPEGDYLPYDIICIGQSFYKVQVKSCKLRKNGSIRLSLRKNMYKSGKSLHTKRYKKHEVDVFAIYILKTDECFYIDANLLDHIKCELTLRHDYPANGRERDVNLLDTYREFPLP